MGTEILKSFSHLQNELDEARSSLKGVDENIKRLIGRDPSDLPPRLVQKRPIEEKNTRQVFSKFSRFEQEDVPKRRNPGAVSVFKRLSDKVPEDPVKPPSKGLISKVIAAPKEVPSRQAMLDKQNKDEKFKERNRRMFGALLGTLQKFQQEESKLKKREDKRSQIEKKIEEHEQQEKEEIKKERQELFLNRKKKQQEIKMIELKMLRMKEYAAWERSQKPRANFIVSKAKPHIHYLPRRMDDKSKELIEKSKKDIEEQIEKQRQAVFEELNHIEERMKRNFDSKHNIETKEEQEKSVDRHDRHRSDSELDDDIEMKEKSPSPEPNEDNQTDKNEDMHSPVKENDSTAQNVENSEIITENSQIANNVTPETYFEAVAQNKESTVIAKNGFSNDSEPEASSTIISESLVATYENIDVPTVDSQEDPVQANI